MPPAQIIDSCITQLKAQGPSRTCNESKAEEEEEELVPKSINCSLGNRTEKKQIPSVGSSIRLVCTSPYKAPPLQKNPFEP